MMRRAGRTIFSGVFLVGLTLTAGCAARAKVKRDPARETASKIRTADSFLRAGKVNEALSQVDQAIAAEPSNGGFRNFYGQICFIAGRNAEAETAFLKALELDPYLTDAHNNLGAVLDRDGRKEDAEREYRLALKDPVYPTPEKVHLNLGLLYASEGRDVEALASMRRAVEINPRYYQAHFELASLLDRLGKLEEAAREYEVALPDYRNSGDYHYRLGLAYLRLQDAEKARQHLLRVREVAPGSESSAKADELLKLIH